MAKHLLDRAGLKADDVRHSCQLFNMFNNRDKTHFYVPPEGMTFDSFKKFFFPKFCMAADDICVDKDNRDGRGDPREGQEQRLK